MDKKEYLTNRFKRDFLQYSLLQEDSLSAKEIAEKLGGHYFLCCFYHTNIVCIR